MTNKGKKFPANLLMKLFTRQNHLESANFVTSIVDKMMKGTNDWYLVVEFGLVNYEDNLNLGLTSKIHISLDVEIGCP